MSMEIAAREALDIEASAILSGAAGRARPAGSTRRGTRNDGDAFAEALAEAKRLAVLDMPTPQAARRARRPPRRWSSLSPCSVELRPRRQRRRGRARTAAAPALAALQRVHRSQPGRRGAAPKPSARPRPSAPRKPRQRWQADRGHRGGLRAPARRRQRGDDHPAASLAGCREILKRLALTARPRRRRPVRRPRRGRRRQPHARDRPTTDRDRGARKDEIGDLEEAVEGIRADTARSIDRYNAMREQPARAARHAAGSVVPGVAHMAATSEEAGRAVGEIASP